MPWISQMLGFALLLIGVAVALWVSFWLLLILFGIGVAAVIYTHVKQYLLQKGILNTTPGLRPEPVDSAHEVTIVEGDFTRIDSKTE